MEVECFLFCLVSKQLHNSTDTQVVLDNVNLASTGRYRCEVSAEAPSFQTVSDHGDMIVVGESGCPFFTGCSDQSSELKRSPDRFRNPRKANFTAKLNQIEF